MSDRFAKLTSRQRDVLRLVHARYVTKEIAAKLGISVDRVNKLALEAMRHLEVSRREIAARLLATHEGHETPTHLLGAQSMGVAEAEKDLPDQPVETSTDGRRDGDDGAALEDQRTTFGPAWQLHSSIPFPFSTSGRPRNDLKTLPTLIAIAAIAILCAGAAGAAISLLFDFNRLVTGV